MLQFIAIKRLMPPGRPVRWRQNWRVSRQLSLPRASPAHLGTFGNISEKFRKDRSGTKWRQRKAM